MTTVEIVDILCDPVIAVDDWFGSKVLLHTAHSCPRSVGWWHDDCSPYITLSMYEDSCAVT